MRPRADHPRAGPPRRGRCPDRYLRAAPRAGGDDIAGSGPDDGRYYDEGWWQPTSPRSALRRRVGGTHRTLATYLNTLRRHGLWLDEAAEPLPPPQWDREHHADRTPVFLAAR